MNWVGKCVLALVMVWGLVAAAVENPPLVHQDIEKLLNLPEPAILSREWSRLESHSIVIKENSFDLPGGRAMVFTSAPPERVFEVITGYDGYIHFMPAIVSMNVQSNEGNEAHLAAEYESQW